MTEIVSMSDIDKVCQVIQQEGVVAFPTETVLELELSLILKKH